MRVPRPRKWHALPKITQAVKSGTWMRSKSPNSQLCIFFGFLYVSSSNGSKGTLILLVNVHSSWVCYLKTPIQNFSTLSFCVCVYIYIFVCVCLYIRWKASSSCQGPPTTEGALPEFVSCLHVDLIPLNAPFYLASVGEDLPSPKEN